MSSTYPTRPGIDSILRAICEASSEAWCYAPVGTDQITHFSREFLHLLELSPSNPETSLTFFDTLVLGGLQKLGISTDRVVEMLKTPHASLGMNRSEFSQISVTVKAVLDEDGQHAGSLFLFSAEQRIPAMHSAWHRAVEAKQQLSVLSVRESEILALIATGLTNKAVARQANISEKTVEKHRASIMRKLRIRSVADLIRRVTEASLIPEPQDTFCSAAGD